MTLWTQNAWIESALGAALVLQTIRRLHDLGRTGWWVAAIYVTEMSLAMLPASYPQVAAVY